MYTQINDLFVHEDGTVYMREGQIVRIFNTKEKGIEWAKKQYEPEVA